MSKADEKVFQNEIISDMLDNGWRLGEPGKYNRETALYEEDLLRFVKESQPKMWRKYEKTCQGNAEARLLRIVAEWLDRSKPNISDREMRRYGTLGVLRGGIRDTACEFTLCQAKPEHHLNPETLQRYSLNRLRIVPELVYSPYLSAVPPQVEIKGKAYRIDLVLFVNGIPIATLELKSEFKQSVENAIKQYKQTRLPKDPNTNKTEPLLTFKRGALVHFAVSQYEVYMCTNLEGIESNFLPFNKGTADGAKGNDIPADPSQYATGYLWNEVLQPDNILRIIHNFVHLEIKHKEDAQGLKYKQETLIFPRYHQWDVVGKLLNAVKDEGPGRRYLIQHSAGSGKSNSIAWAAHQLATLFNDQGDKVYNSVIVVTDRTVLDDQLQDTISQFAVDDAMVGRINTKEGQGSKSEKLATALENNQDIIIVTIQTFGFVLDCIEKSEKLKRNNYAVIADEAHSSQSGSTAKQMKDILKAETEDIDEVTVDDEDEINALAERSFRNLSYFAFTATPKDKTLQLFGRCPDPTQPPSKQNLPEAFHVYTMRQAIEEGFILDVLKNYTTYKAAYLMALKAQQMDLEVDKGKARTKLNKWVALHAHNISQKVRVIVEHFRENVKDCLHGQAKAMVVTSSRKAVVRYKLALDKYVKQQGYTDVVTMVAFSGEVKDEDESYTERNMNPGLKGRDLRGAFDSAEYQLMLVANKFQTGFDQPKLCAMYVDKKLAGVECVQTLSRLNRCYPGKSESGTFVLDFFNNPEDVLAAFKPYYKTAELADVSDPNRVHELFEKLRSQGIYQWNEVERFYTAFMNYKISAAAISNICKPAVERWQQRYKTAREQYKHTKEMFERTKKSGDAVLIANAENAMKEHKKELDALVVFKKDLGSFTRFYEFMSQIIDYDRIELDQLSLFARHLRPLLREDMPDEEEIDLSSVVLTHYRLSKIREQYLDLRESYEECKIRPTSELGSGRAKDKQEDFLSHILQRLNEIFDAEGLTKDDMLNYATTILGKVKENERVMDQFQNNPQEQALLGDFPTAFYNAVMESSDAHENQKMQCLSDEKVADGMMRLIFDMWQNETQEKAKRV